MMTTPAALYLLELLQQYPNTPTKTLAKKAYEAHPELWTDLEGARSMLRYYRGAKGAKMRKHAVQLREFNPSLWNPLNFPGSDETEYLLFLLPKECQRILWMSDIHVPYHNVEALTAAVQLGLDEEVDIVFLGGDFMDFYSISTYEKDPRKLTFGGELQIGRDILARLRETFPTQRFYFMVGNHEERLERYLRVKAPELLDCEEFRLDKLLHFDEHSVEVIDQKRIAHAGDLLLLHGHEFGRGGGGVFPARSLMLKAKASAICVHWHRPSECIENALDGSQLHTWTAGCLCELHPDYLPVNNWAHGCAIIAPLAITLRNCLGSAAFRICSAFTKLPALAIFDSNAVKSVPTGKKACGVHSR